MKLNKIISGLGLTVILGAILIATGCSGSGQNKESAGADAETVELTHSLGTVTVVKNPQRVVALDYSALENLDYLGIKPVAVPKNNLPGHLSKYKNDESIVDVGSINEVNLERVYEVQPDLIIMGGRLAESYDQLSAIAPVIYPTVMDVNDFIIAFESNLDDLALLFDKQDEVDKVKSELRDKIENAKEVIAQSDEKALILLHNRGRFSAYGSGSRFGIIHDVLGVTEAAGGLSVHRHGNPVSSEFIQKANPDIIFVVDRSRVVEREDTNKEEIENLLIKQTNAARNGKIYYLNPDVWYLAGGGVKSVDIMIDEVLQAF